MLTKFKLLPYRRIAVCPSPVSVRNIMRVSCWSAWLTFILLENTAVTASPFTIGASVSATEHTVNYKAFSDSWVVSLPESQNLYSTDLVVAQLCVASVSCQLTSSAALIGNCSSLGQLLLHDAGWRNERLDQYKTADGLELTPLCDELGTESTVGEVQIVLQDVCAEPCAHVLQPLGLEILGSAQNALALFDRDPTPEVMLIQARLVAVTVMAAAHGDSGLVLALSSHAFQLRLERPGLAAVTMNLQHECSRRGLQAPRLSTMDLYLSDSGALVCNWDCRPDHLRTQWNLEPLLKNHTQPEREAMRHLCWPLPQRFVAVLFTLHVGTPVRAPHAALLPPSFYESLNMLADSLQAEHFPNGMVLLNVPRSNFDNFKFADLIKQAVEFRGASDNYEILQVGLTAIPDVGSVAGSSRRLLELGAEQGVLLVEGVVITPVISSTPPHYVGKVRDALRIPPARLPPSVSAVGTSSVREIHRLADSVLVPIPPDEHEPGNVSHPDDAQRIYFSGYAGLESMVFIVLCFFCMLSIVCMAGTRRKRKGERSRSSTI